MAEKECLDPEPPLESIGDVQATGKVFGSKAIYTCPEGFKVIGMEERVCQADGMVKIRLYDKMEMWNIFLWVGIF